MTAGAAAATGPRVVSMDQFRGYTVVGMIFVNFVGDFALCHPVFQHHNTYFSYADSIMPAFHFAVGFAFRLTLLRRLGTSGPLPTYARFLRRNLGLILLSAVLSPIDHRYKAWETLRGAGVWGALAGPLKCEFWETLAIIGVTSIWVLPVMAASARVRLAFLAACAGLHVYLSRSFYFAFMWGRPNALDATWGAANVLGLDGGPLGFLSWCIPQLVGSLAYDAVAARPGGAAWPQLFGGACVLMVLGYGLSCLSVCYPPAAQTETQPEGTVAGDGPGFRVSDAPVWPPPDTGVRPLLAEPPFVPPPKDRPMNYWAMSKRTCSVPFMAFATGFALAVYALFVVLCDRGPVRVGLFRTFGQNPLAAYIIHELVGNAVQPFAPNDSPAWWAVTAFAAYFGVTYLFVRHLERQGVYLRM
jgi:predicted acyltransferase